MVRKIVAQLRERDPAIPCINMLTHNDYNFADPESRVGRNYRDVLAAIKAACDEANIKTVGATLGEIVDDVLNEPYVAPEFDKSGGRIFLNVDDRPHQHRVRRSSRPLKRHIVERLAFCQPIKVPGNGQPAPFTGFIAA